MYIPEQASVGVTDYPYFLILSGQPGIGKSTLINGLNQNGYKALHIDLQGGTAHVGGYRVDVKKIAEEEGISLLVALSKVIKEIKENTKNGKEWDFVAVDPITVLKSLITEKAAALYNASVIGKAAAMKSAQEANKGVALTPDLIAKYYSRDPVNDLGQNGWRWYNDAFSSIYQSLLGLATKSTIFLAHTKYSTLKKVSLEEISVKEIDFYPSYLLQMISDCSDSGAVFRDGSKVMVSFDLIADQNHFKSRSFDGQKFILSEKTEQGFVYHWDQIYPFLNEPKTTKK